MNWQTSCKHAFVPISPILFPYLTHHLFYPQKLTHFKRKSVGGTPFTSTTADQQPTQTPEEKAAELAAFDQKLYKAQLAMNDSMSAVLKGLGVPFFGTHAGLILPDGVESKVGNMLGGQDVQGDRPKWSPRVTADELLELKRRMIGYLEDMYKQ